jgi:hypothetical protein
VALAAGRRGSGGIPAGAAAGLVGEGPGRSPSPPRSRWAPEFGRGKPPASGAPTARGGSRRGCVMSGEGGSVGRRSEATSIHKCQGG